MASSKRRRSIAGDDDSEIVDVQSASSSLRPTQNKRSRLSLAVANGGSVVSDEEDDDFDYSYSRHVDDTVHDNDFPQSDEEETIDAAEAARESQHVLKQLKEHKDNMPQDHGIIEEVFCRNFMCHSKLRIKLGPLINFIIGHNGSGKSAILTALTLCLGAKATATNRGASLKNFIKEGEDNAYLSVKIKNQGEMAYRPEVFGDSIIVERHFNKAGASSFKIKNANDRLVSSKRVDLEDLLDFLALQLENPMNVLTQDMARQFLSSSSPNDKYKFFIRGTQLEQLDRDYRVIEEYLNSTDAKLESREQDVIVLAGRAEEASKKKKMIDRSQSLREKITQLGWMHAWAQVEEQEAELAVLEDKVRDAERQVVKLTQDAEGASNRYEESNEMARAAKGVIDELEQDLAPSKEKFDNLKSQFDSNKKLLTEHKAQFRNINEALRGAKNEVAKTRAAIDEEHARLESANGPTHALKIAQLEEAKSEVEECKQRKEDHHNGKEQLDREVSRAAEERKRDRDHHEEQKHAVQQAQQRLQTLQRDQGQHMANFHTSVPQLRKAIQNENRFRQKPVGPMGMYVRLKKPEWSSIIEKTCGGQLDAFIVTSKHDHTLLSELQKRHNNSSSIVIGDSRPIDTSAHEPDADRDTIMRVLEFDRDSSGDLVRNQLIINQAIEQTVLIKDQDEAYAYAYGSGRPPRNAKIIIAMNKHHRGAGIRYSYTRNGAERSDPVHQWQGKVRMKTDAEAQLRNQQETIDQLRRDADDGEKSVSAAAGACKRTEQAIVRHNREQRDHRAAVQRAEDNVEKLTAELEKDTIDAGKLDALKEQLQQAQEDQSQHAGSYQDAINAKDQLDEDARALKTDMDAAHAELQEGEAKITKTAGKLAKLESTRVNALRGKNEALELIAAADQTKESAERRRQDKIDSINTDYIPGATKIHARVSVEAGLTVAAIDKRLDKLMEERSQFEKRAGGSREQIIEAWAKAHKDFAQAKKELNTMNETTTLLKRTVVNRRGRWRLFRRTITARAQITFMYLLSERAFRGRIIVDHQDKAMDISVEPDIAKLSDTGRQTKTLSGGEKSFSTICLLLSIWEAMGSPIRCLDEFDVFMDNVNRDISMKMMIQAARRAVGRQFILITPQAMGNVQLGFDVKVHKMSDPERGQTALPY